MSRPASVQKPRPVTMNAAFGPPGRDFAAENCDHLFTSFTDIEVGKGHIADIKGRAAKFNRDIGVFTIGHVVCRPTQAEAEDYYDYYSRQNIDEEAVDYHMRQKKNFSQSHEDEAFKQYKQRFSAGTGSYPLVGTPEMVAGRTCKIRRRRLQRRGVVVRELQKRIAVFLRNRRADFERGGTEEMKALS